MSIKLELTHWNNHSIDEIREIYTRRSHEKSFLSDILSLMDDTAFQKAATWLLKRHLENKNKIEASAASEVYTKLLSLEHWESRLHLLQSLPFMPIAKRDRKRVERFLRSCLAESNKFIRAWAYNGFYVLSQHCPEYSEETRQLFEMALRDEAPSVKSRIRNIMKEGFHR